MKEFFQESDYSQLRNEVVLLRKEMEELKAARANRQTMNLSGHWRRLFRPRNWGWMRITIVVFLALAGLGAQNKPDALYIDQNGNVGINKTNPEVPLDVNGSALIRGQLRASGAIPAPSTPLPAGSGVIIGNSDIYFANTPHAHTGQGNKEGFAAIENDSTTNFNALMILGRSRSATCCDRVVSLFDKLSVGKANPQASLDVVGGALFGGPLGIAKAKPEAALDVSGNALVSGRLGIGKTDPQTSLDVSGNSNVSGNLSVGGRADLGIYLKHNSPSGDSHWDISCDGDDVAISGGAWVNAPGALRESRPISQKTWRVACMVARFTKNENYKCEEAWVVCARHAK